MKTLEQIKNFTPKQRNEFIDEMIEMIENADYRATTVSALIVLTTCDCPLIYYMESLSISNDYGYEDDKSKLIHYLKSIKTAE